MSRLNILTAVVKSEYVLSVDHNQFTGCGTCVDRCHFKAVSIENDKVLRDRNRCLGCGVCILTCPADARYLGKKNSQLRISPIESNEVALERLGTKRGKEVPVY